MNVSKNTVAPSWGVAASVLAGAAAAVGASACCAGPLLLVLLGVGGAWSSGLVSLAPLQPFFVAATLGFLGFAFYRLYLRPPECAPGDACAVPGTRGRQKAIFWLVSFLAVTLMAMPLYAPIFY